MDALARLADHRTGGDEQVEKREEQLAVARRADVGELRPAQERRGASQRGHGIRVHRVQKVRLKSGGDEAERN